MPQFLKHVEDNLGISFHNKLGVVLPVGNEKALIEGLQLCIIVYFLLSTLV